MSILKYRRYGQKIREKTHIIINPWATKFKKKLIKKGGGKNQQAEKSVRKSYGKFGNVFITYSLEELASNLQKSFNPNILYVIGSGDGGYHQFATHLFNLGLVKKGGILPAAAPIKAGGMNILANTFGCRGHPLDNLRRIYYDRKRRRKPEEGRIIELPLFEIEADFLDEPKYGFVFMMGPIITDLLSRYHEKGTGMKSALKTGSEALGMVARGDYGFARQAELKILVDGKFSHHRKFFAVSVSSLNKLFFNIQLYLQSKMISTPREFFAVIESGEVKNVAHELLSYLYKPFFSKLTGRGYLGNGRTFNDVVKTLEIRGFGSNLDFTVDGDIYHNKGSEGKLKLTFGGTGRFYVPPP